MDKKVERYLISLATANCVFIVTLIFLLVSLVTSDRPVQNAVAILTLFVTCAFLINIKVLWLISRWYKKSASTQRRENQHDREEITKLVQEFIKDSETRLNDHKKLFKDFKHHSIKNLSQIPQTEWASEFEKLRQRLYDLEARAIENNNLLAPLLLKNWQQMAKSVYLKAWVLQQRLQFTSHLSEKDSALCNELSEQSRVLLDEIKQVENAGLLDSPQPKQQESLLPLVESLEQETRQLEQKTRDHHLALDEEMKIVSTSLELNEDFIESWKMVSNELLKPQKSA